MSKERSSQQISHVTTGYARTINQIVDWADQYEPWTSIRIDGFVENPKIISYIATSQAFGIKTFTPLKISLESGRKLEVLLQELYNDLVPDAHANQWNKLRLIYDRLRDQPFISTQWDEDYAWLNGVSAASNEYLALDSETEHSILTWKGLAKNKPRPWLNTRPSVERKIVEPEILMKK